MGKRELNIPVCLILYIWKFAKRKMNAAIVSSVKLSVQNFPEKHI